MTTHLESANATATSPSAFNSMFHPAIGLFKQPLPLAQHPSRKRVRHRPNRRSRALSMFSSGSSDATRHTTRSHNDTIISSRTSPLDLDENDSDTNDGSMLRRQESAESRDRRMFGGLDDDTESARQLRGPMLDVVLGLFNGLDYDDSTMR